MTTLFGVLDSTPAQIANYTDTNRLAIYGLQTGWDRHEKTTPGNWSTPDLTAYTGDFNTAKAASRKVALEMGLGFPPSFYQNSTYKFVDQFGSNSSGRAIDWVWRAASRDAVEAYIRKLNEYVPFNDPALTDVRIGIDEGSELLFPGDTQGGTTNSYWAFSTPAQGGVGLATGTVGGVARNAVAVPSGWAGWHPGDAYPAGKSSMTEWYNWYLTSLVEAATWVKALLVSLGFTGRLWAIMPGQGARPTEQAAAYTARLADGTNSGVMAVGAAWHLVYPMLATAGINGWCSSTAENTGMTDITQAGDAALSSEVETWSSMRRHGWLATRNSMLRAVENPGSSGSEPGYGLTMLEYFVRQSAAVDATVAMFAHETNLVNGTGGSNGGAVSWLGYKTKIETYGVLVVTAPPSRPPYASTIASPAEVIPRSYFVMSNGDHVVLFFVPGVGLCSSYSLDQGATWSARATISGPPVDGTAWAVCADDTTISRFYVVWSVRTTSLFFITWTMHGARLLYDPGLHTFSATGGSFAIRTFGTAFLNTPGSVTSMRMIHHSGKVHVAWLFDSIQVTLFGSQHVTTYGLTAATASTFGQSAALYSATFTGSPVLGDGHDVGLSPSADLLWAHPVAGGISLIDVTAGGSYSQANAYLLSSAVRVVIETDTNGYNDILYSTETAPWFVGYFATTGTFTHYWAKRVAYNNVTFAGSPATFPFDIKTLIDAGQQRVVVSSSYREQNGPPWAVQTFIGGVLRRTNYVPLNASVVGGWFPRSSPPASIFSGFRVYGMIGGWSSGTQSVEFASVDINYAPVVAPISPVDGAETFDPTLEPIPLRWSYSDVDDTPVQGKFEVQVTESNVVATVYYVALDGTLSATETEVSSPLLTVSIAAGEIPGSLNGYQWRVRAADIHGTYSGWTSWQRFWANGRPTATFTGLISPFASNRPIISWIYEDPEETDAVAWRMRIYNVSDNALLWDSDIQRAIGIANLDTMTDHVDISLTNDINYRVGVIVQDSNGNWSAETLGIFWVHASLPPEPTVTLTVDEIQTSVLIEVVEGVPTSNETTPVSAQLFRYSPHLGTYVLIYDSPSATFDFIDYGPPINLPFNYKVETTAVSGAVGEVITGYLTITADDWRLIYELTPETILLDVQEFGQAPAMSVEMLEPMGRSRQVAVTFTLRGAEGTIKLFVPHALRDSVIPRIEALSQGQEVLLKSPFGESFRVVLGSPAKTYLVGGNVELGVPYTEVASA